MKSRAAAALATCRAWARLSHATPFTNFTTGVFEFLFVYVCTVCRYVCVCPVYYLMFTQHFQHFCCAFSWSNDEKHASKPSESLFLCALSTFYTSLIIPSLNILHISYHSISNVSTTRCAMFQLMREAKVVSDSFKVLLDATELLY